MSIIKKFALDLVYNKKELDEIKGNPLFEGFSYHELSLIKHLIHERCFKKGEFIYKEQFPLATLYLIRSGEIEIRNGYQLLNEAAILKENQFLGIIDMFNESKRTGEAIAITESILIAISHLDIMSFISQNPRAGTKLLKNICSILSRFIYTSQYQDGDKT